MCQNEQCSKKLDVALKKPTSHQSKILLVSVLLLIGFILVASLRPELTSTDKAVNQWSASVHASLVTSIAIAVSILLDTTILLPLTLLIAIVLFLTRHRNKAVLLAAAMAAIALITQAFKTIIQSSRPTNGIVPESGFSFPSGHATSTMVFFGLLTYFAWQHWKTTKTKTLTSILYIAVEAFVGFIRVYLNVHWLSDILGGYLLGAFWLTFMIIIFLYSEERDKSQPA